MPLACWRLNAVHLDRKAKAQILPEAFGADLAGKSGRKDNTVIPAGPPAASFDKPPTLYPKFCS
jgi:hypothetical protein